jgi:hypothetical protein
MYIESLGYAIIDLFDLTVQMQSPALMFWGRYPGVEEKFAMEPSLQQLLVRMVE